SPDGRILSYVDAAGLHVSDLDGHDSELLDSGKGCKYQALSWSGVGTAIAAQRKCLGDASWSIVAISDLGGEAAKRVLTSDTLTGFPAGYRIADESGIGALRWTQD